MKAYRRRGTERAATRKEGRVWLSVIALAWFMGGSGGAAWAECTTSICSGDPCTITGTHYIDNLCDLNFGCTRVTVAGSASLRCDGGSFTIEAGDLTVSGTLRARAGSIGITTTSCGYASGNFTTNVVSTSPGTIDVSDGGSADISAGGSVTLNGKNVDADNGSGYAGDIAITGTSVTGTSAIHADGGAGGDGGTLDVTSTAGDVSLTGNVSSNGGGSYGWGGNITVDSAGALTVGASTKSIQAKGASGGDGGYVTLTAVGNAAIDGNISVNGAGTDGGYAGDIWIDAASISIASASALTATGGSGGGDGGLIDVIATCGITVSGDMNDGGRGDMAYGGDITIDAGTGTGCTLTINSTSLIEADSTGTDAVDGTIDLSACNVTHSGALDSRNVNLDSGTNSVHYRGSFTANAGSSMVADDAAAYGGNDIYCRCVDTNPADGVCDAPAACVSNPTLNGSSNPTPTIYPVAMPACGS